MSLEINLIPFNIIKNEVDIYFSLSDNGEGSKIYKENLPKNFPSNIEITESAWWSLEPSNHFSIKVNVSLLENMRFSKNYFNLILLEHFIQKKFLTTRSFINDPEIWVHEKENRTLGFNSYKKFSIKTDLTRLTDKPCLLLSFGGISHILTKNITQLEVPDESLNKVLYKNRVVKFDLLTEAEKSDKVNIFPILQREIRKTLKISIEPNFSSNKYKKYYEEISKFYQDHLKGVEIGSHIKIFSSGFEEVPPHYINDTTQDSNLLLFGHNKTHFSPYNGLKDYGPVSPPTDQLKFIFIFHQEDKEYANKLYSYFKKGYKSFSGLEPFVKVPFEIDTSNSIQFINPDNPLPEIESKLYNSNFDPRFQYIALYISRISKDDPDDEKDLVYFRLKELLLKNKIISQVIFKNNINNNYFNFFLPNIAIAICAKAGGVPWRLFRPIKKDLIVGIGAYKSEVGTRFLGNSFCFKNDGKFMGFNAFDGETTTVIAQSIEESLISYLKENEYADRLIIHYYKPISYKEEEPIRNTLSKLKIDIPYVVITINDTESKDYVLFDPSFDGKMPQSGKFVKIRYNEFLLCNNTRYAQNTGAKLEGFPFPIKIKIKPSDKEKFNDDAIIKELIDQVYQFSRMYWKSVKQRNKPVTIEYSEMVAKIFSHFETRTLPEFAKDKLWFL